ncbi:hypothetical protein KGQ20_15915 [Catenulispora sp. NF23]|uniref:Cytoplasmic membrane protein n=1 Tax=Catenulispora pinistramenti TaxID=2705254 RepID=A0ABS5KXY8_9ACTN|nr:hypothetical protein [Catenulispora pinistramenti]MBS2534257.1 hypothetical protein [Catenulispora pinistramenti]MBS2550815.1 hypothetical protein [Catenulispora pinistramenti]
MDTDRRLRRIRLWLALFITGLVLSGVTAFPLETETRWLSAWLHHLPAPAGLTAWIDRAHEALKQTNAEYPFIAYGTDWLAFGHLTIAVAFYGPWRDPVRNKWVIQFGMIACAGIVPLALICGPIRGIPFWWSVIDMSFGVFGVLPLIPVWRHIKVLEALAALAATGPGPAHTPPGVSAAAPQPPLDGYPRPAI